ncbi:MAG: VanZ family protein [Clostridiales bacterium]|nr:VanZ family protein [Clostridiales bacterium]
MKTQTNKAAYTLAAIFFWAATAAIMITIFYLSHQQGSESESTSTGFLAFVEGLLGITIDHGVFREIAHAAEFFALAFCAFFAIGSTCGYFRPVLTLIAASAYAVTDEIHQIFVPGRAFQVFDWLVDTSGAAAGVLVCAVIVVVIGKFNIKRRSKS